MKVLLIGESGCGKSALFRQFNDGRFIDVNSKTIGKLLTPSRFTAVCLWLAGVAHGSKTVTVGGKILQIQTCDIGEIEPPSTIPIGYRDPEGIILVYDCTNQDSFDSLDKWVHAIKSCAGRAPFVFLCANKSDLSDAKVVSVEQGKAKARDLGYEFFEVSAATGDSVKKMFLTLAQQSCAQKDDTEVQASSLLCHCTLF